MGFSCVCRLLRAQGRAPRAHAGSKVAFLLEDQSAIGHGPALSRWRRTAQEDKWQSRMSRAGDDPAWSLLDVGGRRVSEATVSVRDSSRADLIGPRVVMPRRTPQPCQCEILGDQGEKSMTRAPVAPEIA